MDDKHELFWQIEAFDPHWQKHYKTLREAAVAADCLPDYYDYLQTSEGLQYRIRMQDVPDTLARNAAERRLRERMAAIARRGGHGVDLQDTDDYGE